MTVRRVPALNWRKILDAINQHNAAASSKDRSIVTAVSRGLSILSAFSSRDVWLGNSEIAARTRLPKATVSRLTQTLSMLGYLHHSRRRKQYRLGVAVLTLGYAVLGNLDVRKVARPSMQAFADSCNVLVALGARERLDMIHLETCHSNSTMLTLRVDSGSRARVATTAFGRALLAALSNDEREAAFQQMSRHYRDQWPKLKGRSIRRFARYTARVSVSSWGCGNPTLMRLPFLWSVAIDPKFCPSDAQARPDTFRGIVSKKRSAPVSLISPKG